MTTENNEIDFSTIDPAAIAEAFKGNPDLGNKILKGLEKGKAAADIQKTNAALKNELRELETKSKKNTSSTSEAEKNGWEIELNKLRSEIAEEKKAKAASDLRASETALENVVIAASQNPNYPLRAVDSKEVFHLLKINGLVGIDENGNQFYHKTVDGKKVATNVEDCIQSFLNTKKHLAAAGGSPGTGQRHTNSPGVSGNGLLTEEQLNRNLMKI